MPLWGVWKLEPGPDGRPAKIPYNPKTGARAKPNTPSTFGTRAQAERARACGKYSGPCYLVDASLGITAGDLDHVVSEADAFNEAALPPAVRRIIRIANTDTTWSPSGTGIHLIFGTAIDGYENRNGARVICHAEAYNHVRYMTHTDRRISDTPVTFNDDPDDLIAWYEALGFRKREAEQPPQPQPERAILSLATEEIITRASSAQNGAKFRELYDGGLCGKRSPSEARYALISSLLFWTRDPGQIEDIVRSSRQWNAKTKKRPDLVRKEIDKQLRAYTGNHYDPNHRSPSHTAADPIAAAGDIPPTETQDITGDNCNDVRAELAAARETIKQLQRDKSMLMALLLNPYVTAADKTAVAATLDKSIRKQPGEDGLVALKPGEIANDWRPRAKPGQNTEPLNRDGSKPRMSRSAVKRTMAGLTMRNFIEAKPKKTDVTPKDREPYTETVWLVKPPTSVADFLAPIALYEPKDKAPRKPRTITPQCPDCGVDLNVKTWTVAVTETSCPECGQVHRDEVSSRPRTVTPIVSIDPDGCAGGYVDKRSTVRSVAISTVDKRSTCSTPPLDNEPPDYWIPPDDQYRYRPGTGEGAGNDRWTA